MKGLEYGPLQGITVTILEKHETSLRYALARVLDLLARGQDAELAGALSAQVGGRPLWIVLGDALGTLSRGRVYSRAEVVDMVAKATGKLGERDEGESQALSRPGRQVIAWPSGEILAFEKVEGGWHDATEKLLEELDAEEEPEEPSLWSQKAPELVEDLDARLSRERPVEAFMCSLCAQGIAEGEQHSHHGGKPAHLACVEGEEARRTAKGVYGTAEQMRQELARLGRPVGEVWDIRELEQAVLAARRETDEIPWGEYETRKASRKQGRPCVECSKAIVKGDEYRQASRGRKAHEACLKVETPAG